jgi:hypothetical protein
MLKVGPFSHSDYLAVLKWKQGERNALLTYRPSPNRLHVLFDIPPAGDFDHDEKRRLTPTEHIKMFGKRLHDAWGNRVAFIDAGMVDDDLHKKGLTRHPLTELIERARTAGALACPCVSLNHSAEYHAAVRRFVERNPELPICIRVEANHLDAKDFQPSLLGMLSELQCEASRCFLVLDFKALDTPTEDAVDQFVEALSELLAALPSIHRWLGLAVVMSSFPIAIRLKPGQVEEYPRTDLMAYRKLISNPKELLRTPMFGDYALDTSPMQKPERRTPSAHFRYSTPKSYAVAKGTTVKKPFGYDAIYPVADLLVSQPFFMGPSFSLGDRFIADLQTRPAAKGNAAKWRWASTDHHLTGNLEVITQLYGLEDATATRVLEPELKQTDMFHALESPSTAPASPEGAEIASTTDRLDDNT